MVRAINYQLQYSVLLIPKIDNQPLSTFFHFPDPRTNQQLGEIIARGVGSFLNHSPVLVTKVLNPHSDLPEPLGPCARAFQVLVSEVTEVVGPAASSTEFLHHVRLVCYLLYLQWVAQLPLGRNLHFEWALATDHTRVLHVFTKEVA